MIDSVSGSSLGVWNATGVTTRLANNAFYGLTPSQIIAGPNVQSNSTFLATHPVLNESHAFAQILDGGAGPDWLIGGTGDDVLRGRRGTDNLNGGDGNDVLIGGAGADVHNGGTGIDRAQYNGSLAGLTVDLQAPANNTGIAIGDSYIAVENLYGSNFEDNLRGNAGANTIWGGTGNDIIYGRNGNDTLTGGDGNDLMLGGAGNDKLTGGTGLDKFRFDTALNATTNVDHIFDFNSINEKVQLSHAVFTAAGGVGTLAGVAFFIGAAAHDASDRIIYNGATGALRYDPDDNGATAATQFATLSTGLALTNANFQIV